MAIKVNTKVRHNGKDYDPGMIIEEINKKDEERLIMLGVGDKVVKENIKSSSKQKNVSDKKKQG